MHLSRLPALFAVYPDARILRTHRDPAKTMPSSVSTLVHGRWTRSDDVDPMEIATTAVFGLTMMLNGIAAPEAGAPCGSGRRAAVPRPHGATPSPPSAAHTTRSGSRWGRTSPIASGVPRGEAARTCRRAPLLARGLRPRRRDDPRRPRPVYRGVRRTGRELNEQCSALDGIRDRGTVALGLPLQKRLRQTRYRKDAQRRQ